MENRKREKFITKDDDEMEKKTGCDVIVISGNTKPSVWWREGALKEMNIFLINQ